MKKKKHKQKRPVRQAEGNTRDLVIANKVSGSVHGGLSRIRLSLTFRIALHYCIQLIRSVIPAALILSVLLCVSVSFPVYRELKSMVPLETEDGEETISRGYLTLTQSDVLLQQDFFPRMGQQFSVFFGHLFSREEVRFYYSAPSDRNWLVSLNIHDFLIFWLSVKRVLAPIRDIASMAETLSESNLSNRINIAGTKNELKDLAAVINRMLDRIERSYNSQKQFVSDASHELRTPISVIRGYTDMLKRWGKDDPEILDEGIAAISQETEGMKDLVESLLFLARHDKKTLMMEISSFDPAELLREVQKEETMVHTEYSFEVTEADSLTIEADRNLCDNAVKYSPQGTSVFLSCRNDGNGYCSLSVKDQGQGISQEDLPKIFDRFYRSDKARKSDTGGHGLGLSIARIIVVAHNGKIKVRSKPGAGTVFSVLLPSGKKAV